MSTYSLLKNKSFVAYFIATLLALLGEGMFFFAFTLHIANLTQRSTSVAYLFIITMVPSIILAPFAGALIDKFSRIKIANYTNLLRGTVAIILAFLLKNDATINTIWAAVLLYYIFWYILQTDLDAILPDIVPDELMTNSLSVTQIAWQIGLLGAAAAAGFIMESYGIAYAIGVAGICDLSVNIALLVLYKSKCNTNSSSICIDRKLKEIKLENDQNSESWLKSIKKGYSYVTENENLIWLCLACSCIWPAYQGLNTLFPIFCMNKLSLSETSMGFIDGACGIGSIFSAFICLYASKLKREADFGLFFTGLSIGSVILFSLSTGFYSAFMGYLIVGAMFGSAKVLTRSLVFNAVTEKYMGRVMSLVSMLSLILSAITSLAIAYIADLNIYSGYIALCLLLCFPVIFVTMGTYKNLFKGQLSKMVFNLKRAR